LLAAVLAVGARAAKQAPVTATVLPVGPDIYRVSVLFPDVPDEAKADAAMNTLVQKSGWKPENATWTTTPKEKNFPSQTSTSFTVRTLFPNGEFPVEAFALAFREWGEVNVMFAHGGAFQYKGQKHYENADVSLDATPGPTSLALHILIKNPHMERFTLTPPLSDTPPDRLKPPPRSVPPALWALMAVLGGALVWVMVYALFSKPRKA
jgi:hypothetical protein